MKSTELYQDLYDEKDDIPTWYCSKCLSKHGGWGEDKFIVGMGREGDSGYYMLDNCPNCGENTL